MEGLVLEQGIRQTGPAIDSTLRSERRRLLNYIRGRVRNDADAEDLLQDVFFQFAASYSVMEPIENMTSWLFTVARNKITDWYRKRRHVPLPEIPGEEGPLNLEDILFDPQDGPDRAYWRSTVWAELAEALEDLPEEQRQVFIWNEIEGRTFKEIADMTGAPLNTLLSRKRYAVLYLRERLQELYSELERS